jgi:c-di-GMP-binding flagellar brake protein YcgR
VYFPSLPAAKRHLQRLSAHASHPEVIYAPEGLQKLWRESATDMTHKHHHGTTAEPNEIRLNLEEAKLQIGDALQLQSLNEQNPVRYAVSLIGFAKGKSVMVSVPEIDGKLLIIRDGQTFVVRAFSGRNVYAFTAMVIKSTSAPFPHLHLSYPADVRGLAVRKGARAKVKIIFSASREDDPRFSAAGTIENMSISGALAVSKTPIGKKGDRVTIKFKALVAGIESFLALPCIVRAVNVDQDQASSGENHYGVEFVDAQPQDMIVLSAFVYQKLLEQATIGG